MLRFPGKVADKEARRQGARPWPLRPGERPLPLSANSRLGQRGPRAGAGHSGKVGLQVTRAEAWGEIHDEN